MTFGFSARPVQIATVAAVQRLVALVLCLHMPRADCNYYIIVKRKENLTFASTRPVQIATSRRTDPAEDPNQLCLHTPRADCNVLAKCYGGDISRFASTRPVQIATSSITAHLRPSSFASTRPVQIATPRKGAHVVGVQLLCLHTPRADCNGRNAQNAICTFQNVC